MHSTDHYDAMADLADHCVIIRREGASLRTGVDLSALFVRDAAHVLGDENGPLSVALTYAEGAAVILAESDGSDPDKDDDWLTVLADCVRDAENALADGGYTYVWDDGYRVYSLRGLDDDAAESLSDYLHGA